MRCPTARGGIFIGPGTSGTTIGGSQPAQANSIVFNQGNGLDGVYATGDLRGTVFVGNSIQSNLGSGMLLNAATDLTIGGKAFGEANTITANARYGVAATGRCSRTRVIRNVLGQNTLGPVDLAGAQGIIYVP